MEVRVLRSFDGTGVSYRQGEVVDLDGRNLEKLIELRFCAPVGAVALAEVSTAQADNDTDARPSGAEPPRRGRPKNKNSEVN